jgi:hypothetical protein
VEEESEEASRVVVLRHGQKTNMQTVEMLVSVFLERLILKLIIIRIKTTR